jgi:uncharacterized phage infection (PIP) family protein YhgE
MNGIVSFSESAITNVLADFMKLPTITQASLGFVFLLLLYFHAAYSEKAVDFGPTILTTTGIFFTFFGIAIGLKEFDVSNIQGSVPALLGGLKTAFWASVAGVGGALTLKTRHYAFGVRAKKDGEPVTGATIDDLAESLRGIHWALAGDSDATLVSQLKLARQDTNDRLDALKKAQTEALQMLSQMGSQALVEALRDVIKDFNARINEQFGENFKHPNDGVAKLLVWQEQYRLHVETMTTRLEEILSIAQATTDTHRQVVDQSSIFATIAAELSVLLSGLETQKSQINSYAQSLAALLNLAKDAVPQFESHITSIATELAQAASKSQQTMSRAIEESAAGISRTLESASKASSKAADEYNKQIAQLVAKSKEQIDLLDAALSDELKKSLEALGGQLAALSEKFVSDYGPLTDRLREVVRIAERLR